MPPRLAILVVRRLIHGYLRPARDAPGATYAIRKPLEFSIERYMSRLVATAVAGAVVDFVEKDRVTL